MTATGNGKANGHDADARADAGIPWPQQPIVAGHHGIVGTIVLHALAAHTEAAPEALLLHILILAGNYLGRESYIELDGSRHAPNLNVLFVGPTSSGRKGSAYSQARQLFPWDFLRNNLLSGLSTGEGLIHAVRDRETAVADDGLTTKVVDPGVVDKRKVAVEEEFSRTLRAMNRPDSTLSPILRLAWDGRDLATATRKSPMRATEPHISVIGHITPEELRIDLADISAANGLGNRFLYICTRRSQILPFGGKPDPILIGQLRTRLIDAITDPRRGEIELDAAARVIWGMHYKRLSEPQPGMLGAICARGAPQVLRLALLFALLDKEELIGREHVCAGLDIWDYSVASARHIFGDSLGDPLADKIIAVLRAQPLGMSRSDIWTAIGRRGDMDGRLAMLMHFDRAAPRNRATGGRAAEIWFAKP